jgi:hypothetical protein
MYHFPEYGNAFERRNPTPDFRNTLYWLPVEVYQKKISSDFILPMMPMNMKCGSTASTQTANPIPCGPILRLPDKQDN